MRPHRCKGMVSSAIAAAGSVFSIAPGCKHGPAGVTPQQAGCTRKCSARPVAPCETSVGAQSQNLQTQLDQVDRAAVLARYIASSALATSASHVAPSVG